MNGLYHAALQKLGFRQQSYRQVFAEGGPAHLVLSDLADYSRAFQADSDGLSHDMLMTMHGRRQMFFRIVNQLKLSQPEMEAVYRHVLMRAASRMQAQGADE